MRYINQLEYPHIPYITRTTLEGEDWEKFVPPVAGCAPQLWQQTGCFPIMNLNWKMPLL